MKLLVLTQKVDKDDAVLGFFHKWLEKMAARCESVVVICLGCGRYDLPVNIKVLSLGKEQGASRLRYVINFFNYIWRERRNYDRIFVHMNPEYLVLGGWLWFCLRKPAYLWFNHQYGNWLARCGQIWTTKIFYTSPQSFFAGSSKSISMPVGIDTDNFRRQGDEPRQNNSCLCLGRISPVKNIEVLIEAVKMLDKNGVGLVVKIIGSALNKDQDYLKALKASSAELVSIGKVFWQEEIPNYQTPTIYRQYDFFVNLTNSGSLDKAILEAMACGCLTLVSNTSLEAVLPAELLFKEKDSIDLSQKIIEILGWTEEKKEALRVSLADYVEKAHSLNMLLDRIFFYLNS
ncbi:MAG: glycosyltransferase family 4 protein [Patescibacteria group bacterium]|jgi:glycosyltransferase involved in cell wall biosynthesis